MGAYPGYKFHMFVKKLQQWPLEIGCLITWDWEWVFARDTTVYVVVAIAPLCSMEASTFAEIVEELQLVPARLAWYRSKFSVFYK